MSLPIIQTIQNNINSLNSSKLDIKNAVNTDYDFIANEQIESYPSLIKQGIAHYKNRVPHATKEGTDLSFDAVPLKFENMTIKGDTSQDSTNGVQLLDMSDAVNGYFTNNDGALNTANTGFHTQKYIDVSGISTIYGRFEALSNIRIGRFWMQEYDENYNSLQRTILGIYDVTFTSGEVKKYSKNLLTNTKYIRLSSYSLQELDNGTYVDKNPVKDNWNNLVKATISFTDVDYYEPFSNGYASPSPDFPQPIHVVTGNNTISIGNTNYTINLGSIELCKIGNYQDYLYKENGNWYKYGAINKATLNGSETYISANTGVNVDTTRYYARTSINRVASVGLFNKFINRDASMSHGDYEYNWFNGTDFYINILKSRLSEVSTDGIKQYVTSNNLIGYGALRTPSSTQITDQTLIAQLNAIDKAKGVDGTTIITIDSDDLKPILNFTAYLKEVE